MAKKQDNTPCKVRVLTDCYINGEFYKGDSTPVLDAATIAGYEPLGVIDSNEDAVAYAESLNV